IFERIKKYIYICIKIRRHLCAEGILEYRTLVPFLFGNVNSVGKHSLSRNLTASRKHQELNLPCPVWLHHQRRPDHRLHRVLLEDVEAGKPAHTETAGRGL
ncbi:MAG: hypothetical protein II278_00275, partial [Bacteroidaceae bacterium]|nr:hypothetical protein [Bacteroidaceae bacterium]